MNKISPEQSESKTDAPLRNFDENNFAAELQTQCPVSTMERKRSTVRHRCGFGYATAQGRIDWLNAHASTVSDKSLISNSLEADPILIHLYIIGNYTH